MIFVDDDIASFRCEGYVIGAQYLSIFQCGAMEFPLMIMIPTRYRKTKTIIPKVRIKTSQLRIEAALVKVVFFVVCIIFPSSRWTMSRGEKYFIFLRTSTNLPGHPVTRDIENESHFPAELPGKHVAPREQVDFFYQVTVAGRTLVPVTSAGA